jgi:hypothetical protein
MLSKKSKIEGLRKSRKGQDLVVLVAVSLCRACTKVCDRFAAIRCGPSHCSAWDASVGADTFRSSARKDFFDSIDPWLTSMTELAIDGRNSLLGPVLIRPVPRPASLFTGKRPYSFQRAESRVQRQNKEHHMPWLANTFWQFLLSLVRFCCKHC